MARPKIGNTYRFRIGPRGQKSQKFVAEYDVVDHPPGCVLLTIGVKRTAHTFDLSTVTGQASVQDIIEVLQNALDESQGA